MALDALAPNLAEFVPIRRVAGQNGLGTGQFFSRLGNVGHRDHSTVLAEFDFSQPLENFGTNIAPILDHSGIAV
jgi:hypothetical protein